MSNVANDSLKRYQAGEEILELEQYIEDNSDKKFEIARCVNISISDDSVYSVEDKDIYGICETFSCTYYGHPNYKEEMKNFGTDNMYANLLNDGVYFVDDNDNSQVDMMRKYLQKYYSEGETVECLEYQSVSHYCIYSFSLQ
ncbi:MAG: hypothetical protein LUF33_02025 [Clostridiales bacterium]|nr:hypothetical protein [Clostridiales bacterium]